MILLLLLFPSILSNMSLGWGVGWGRESLRQGAFNTKVTSQRERLSVTQEAFISEKETSIRYLKKQRN